MLGGEREEGGEKGALDGYGGKRERNHSKHWLCLKKQPKWVTLQHLGLKAGACKTLT